jgi:hypothetical protein
MTPVKLSYSTVAAMRRLGVGLDELMADEFDVPEEVEDGAGEDHGRESSRSRLMFHTRPGTPSAPALIALLATVL